jgi:hypothetical protein
MRAAVFFKLIKSIETYEDSKKFRFGPIGLHYAPSRKQSNIMNASHRKIKSHYRIHPCR